MSRTLCLAGACPVPGGTLVFGRDRRTNQIFPICPMCGTAWPDYPKPPMTIEDYRTIESVCPNGISLATTHEVEVAGLQASITQLVEEYEVDWNLACFHEPN